MLVEGGGKDTMVRNKRKMRESRLRVGEEREEESRGMEDDKM